MSNTSDDMLAAANRSKATANGEAAYKADHRSERKSKWSLTREKSAKENGSRRARISLGLAIGGGLVVAVLLLLTQRGGDSGTETDVTPATDTFTPSTTTPSTLPPTTTAPSTTAPSATTGPSSPAALTATCRGEPCAALQVGGTLETPGGEGVWIRGCFDDSPCERRALAAEGQQIYAVCRVDTGKDVFGNTVWVKTPWSFTGPIPQDQPVRAEATGHSDPESQEYGWATTYYLTPRAAIEALPLCST